ncbi:MAG: hypothetical protein MAG451_02089 [Anaerolineales bacterium]|nr:hypothetical protein [Anaerolineales bacterium]
MKRTIHVTLVGVVGLLLLLPLLVGCGARQEAATPQAAVQEAPAAEKGVSGEPPAQPEADFASSTGGLSEDRSQANQGVLDSRKVIRTADLTLVVEDTQTAVNQLRSLANTLGGYVADANLWQVKEDLMRGSVTLRIDARNFDDALDRVKQIALEVQRENIGSQDVTQEYTDLKARLRNLEATEQELLALLSDVRKQTHSADEVLQVYRELTRIREEIEQIKGRMQYLENQISLATINVELIPKEEKPIIQAGWQPGQTLRDALGALASAGQWFVNSAIWLVVFVLPVGVVVALPLVLIVAGIRRWRRQPAGGEVTSSS